MMAISIETGAVEMVYPHEPPDTESMAVDLSQRAFD